MSFTYGAAVIGTGRMGSAMAARLRAAGIAVVVSNRTRERALDLAARCGVTVAWTSARRPRRHPSSSWRAGRRPTSTSLARCWTTSRRAAFLDPDATPVAFTIGLVAKDLDLVLGLARRIGVRMKQAETTRAAAGEAIAAGWGNRDLSAMAACLCDRGLRDGRADDGGDREVR